MIFRLIIISSFLHIFIHNISLANNFNIIFDFFMIFFILIMIVTITFVTSIEKTTGLFTFRTHLKNLFDGMMGEVAFITSGGKKI